MTRTGLRRISVRSRILAVILIVTALGMTVSGVTAYLVQRDRTIAGLDADLLATVEAARGIVTGTSAPAASTDEGGATGESTGGSTEPTETGTVPTSVLDALNGILSRIVPGRHESSVALIDGEVRLLPGVDTAFDLEDDPAFMTRAWEEASGGQVTLGTAITTVGTLRYVAVPVTIPDDPAVGVFVTAIDAQRAIDEVSGAFLTYAGLALASLGAIGVIGWFVAGRLLSPLRTLAETASRITAQDLGERIPVTGRDDVSTLTETVNAMLDRIDEALTSQRQLLDDVRHELKTPITIVRGHLELLDPTAPDDVRSVRELAIDELDRMAELVNDIDALARVETRVVVEPVDVGDLTAQVFAKMQAIPGKTWVLSETATAVAPLSTSRITQAWLQLADNAAKYAPEGTTVRVGSTAYSGSVELWVADEGPGIPAGAEKRIFERFGRADTGRGIAGSGLGLPIVAAIARAHGGYVSLDSSSSGSRFGIVVPTVEAAAPPPPPPAPGFPEDEEAPTANTPTITSTAPSAISSSTEDR
ncbi:MAG: HAMP domain-containing histidine kinase [Yonghaparkia sp.]|nr:HAMP domain-containing histidine kinase [Microcella sp.]